MYKFRDPQGRKICATFLLTNAEQYVIIKIPTWNARGGPAKNKSGEIRFYFNFLQISLTICQAPCQEISKISS